MAETLDIGRRIELVSRDPLCHDISIGLYCQIGDAGPGFLVHSYADPARSSRRIEHAVEAMVQLGGMERTEGGRLRFPCSAAHQRAVKRLFLDACKLDPACPVVPHPLQIFDKKAGCSMIVASLGSGAYQIAAQGGGANGPRRVAAIAGGLAKLGEMQADPDEPGRVSFGCGQAHDSLVGLLLIRALNARVAAREDAEAASRGVMAAPSQR